MKALNLLLLIVFLAVGCRSTKKIAESSAVVSNKTEVVHKSDVKEETKINNDKATDEETVITTTEYFAPSEIGTSTAVDQVIKSVTVKVTKKKEIDKGKIETIKADNSQTATKTDSKSEVVKKEVDKKTVPIQWGWIFGIMAICAGAFIYLKRSKVFPWIKSVLSPAGKNQKI